MDEPMAETLRGPRM